MVQWLQNGQVNACCEEHLPVFVGALADIAGLTLAQVVTPAEPAPTKGRRRRGPKLSVADGPDGAGDTTPPDVPDDNPPEPAEAETEPAGAS
jgi:hypothetical protein